MQVATSRAALSPRRFGRGPQRLADVRQQASPISADLKLFGMTFLAGFIFVSILIG